MSFKTLFILAWRNLWRNYRRTLIMLVAIGIGAWAMIFLTAMTRGMMDDMVAGGISNLPGHIQIHHPLYRQDPNIENSIPFPSGDFLDVLNTNDVETWSAHVRVMAVVSSERDSRGVTLVGIDPDNAVGITAKHIIEGRFLKDADDKGLIIGAKLAERLETRIGKRVVVMSQDPENNVVDKGFRIVGIFKGRLEIQEELMVLAGRTTVQKLLTIGTDVHEIAIVSENLNSLTSLSARLSNITTNAEVLTWMELDEFLGQMQKMMGSIVFIYVLIIFVALSFGLVNTLVMAIFERMREIGLMLALGMRPSTILYQILVESLLLLVLGLAAGNIIAGLSIFLLADGVDISSVSDGLAMFGASNVLTPSFYWEDLILANVVVITLGLLASLLPAWRASHLDPVIALTKT